VLVGSLVVTSMEDKEVGKLWKFAHEVLAERDAGLRPSQPITAYAEYVEQLIRKLVAERTLNGLSISLDKNRESALRDFGIDGDTF
jgi:hypothetical protein